MTDMSAFDAMAELIAGGRFGELGPEQAAGLARDALSDGNYLNEMLGEDGLDTSSMFSMAMDEYSGQRYPEMAKAASEASDRADRMYETDRVRRMAGRLGLSDSDLGSAMAARKFGDPSPMNKLRERFYFG